MAKCNYHNQAISTIVRITHKNEIKPFRNLLHKTMHSTNASATQIYAHNYNIDACTACGVHAYRVCITLVHLVHVSATFGDKCITQITAVSNCIAYEINVHRQRIEFDTICMPIICVAIFFLLLPL